MAHHLSEPFESLLPPANSQGGTGDVVRARVVIVGSGYGGSVAAYRLSGRGKPESIFDHDVMVLERGNEFALGQFPTDVADLGGNIRVQRCDGPPAGNEDALFSLHTGKGVDVLVGSGLGGTSLINANVALQPEPRIFSGSHWPAEIRAEASLEDSPLWRSFEEVKCCLGIEDVGQHPDVLGSKKHQAFKRYANALGFSVQPARIAVRLGQAGTNWAGVHQDRCTRCGNCVSGCNVGAKNTLMMNLIPAAKQRGAKFYTGASVLDVTHDSTDPSTPWRIRVRPTSRSSQAKINGAQEIKARYVVLAAGTLGSTEILLRSVKRGLSVAAAGRDSPLGGRFSTNGDAIAMSFAQRDEVGAIGTEDFTQRSACGPTITGVAFGNTRKVKGNDAFTLQEGAVPAAISGVFGEIITIAAQFGRFANNKLPGWHKKNQAVDPLAVTDETQQRSQIFLVMSDDGSKGSLQLASPLGDLDKTHVVPVWTPEQPPPGWRPNPVLERVEKMLRKGDRKKALDRGQYVPNPLWRLLPDAAAEVMSGLFPGGRLVSVHPLGGCVMGDNGTDGVVNHFGQVFSDGGEQIHKGLFVLDGAIVPQALGVNPFLTISALAWRACEALRLELGKETVNLSPVSQPAELTPRYRGSRGKAASVVVRERLLGKLAAIRESKRQILERHFPSSPRWFEYDGLILHVETLPDQNSKLTAGAGQIDVKAMLYENLVPAHRAERARTYGAPSAHVNPKQLVAKGKGTITILARNEATGIARFARAINAFLAYLQRRETLRSILQREGKRDDISLGKILKGIKAMYDIADMHATYRDFEYDLKLSPENGSAQKDPSREIEFRIAGRKRIAWRPGHPRVWQSLIELPAQMEINPCGIDGHITFEVDTGYLVGDGLLRVQPEAARDFIKGLMHAGGFAAYFIRSILQSAFWEFGSPEYPEKPLVPNPALPDRLKDGTPLDPVIEMRIPIRKSSGKLIPLRLHRYPSRATRQGVALLIHGLAQGSLIYAHKAMPESLTEYLHAAGFDVWLVDYRLSNVFTPDQVPFDGWTMDEIGQIDLPMAIKTVVKWYKDNEQIDERLHVFGHCVGAAGMAIAILDKQVSPGSIQSLVLNAIHPWTLPSPANQLRARTLGAVRDFADDDLFDPIIQDKTSLKPASALVDRAAFSLARLGEQEGAHPLDGDSKTYGQSICDRMTFTYGRMWRHENTKAVHPYWKDLVGRAPGSVQRHLYYTQIHKRLLDHEGQNSWLREELIRAHWAGFRTLFMHGDLSDVFNAQSATRSAARFVRVLTDNGAGTLVDVVALKRVRGYGHMDVILGDDAPDRSFPYLREFFKGSFDHGTSTTLPDGRVLQLDPIDLSDDAHVHAQLQPECGPAIRGAYVKSGLLTLKLWLELPWINTSATDEIEVTGGIADPQYSIEPGVIENRFQWFDVELDPAQLRNLDIRARAGGIGIQSIRLPWRTEGLRRSAPTSRLPLFSIGELLRGSSGWVSADQIPWVKTLVARNANEPPSKCDFLVGSCLYPGTPFDREAAEAIFVRLAHQICAPRGGDALFLIGDLIYADALAGLLDPVAWRDRYQGRYRDAFKMPALREVLNSIPTHFTVDDHEFADDFAGPFSTLPSPAGPHRSWHEDLILKRMKRGELASGAEGEFEFARNMARSYLHSGRVPGHGLGTSLNQPQDLWYRLDHELEFNCPAFVLDTRSERSRATATSPARLMTGGQMDALRQWLKDFKTVRRPKFIFSGSVIVPLPRDRHVAGGWLREDGWAGYPEELSSLLRFIASEEIEGVVFVGGDLHFSAVARLDINAGGKNIEAWQIVSSGLYAPLPFVNPDSRAFAWFEEGSRSTLDLPGCELHYEPSLLAEGAAHFVHIRTDASTDTADHWTMVVTAHAVPTAGSATSLPTCAIGPLKIKV